MPFQLCADENPPKTGHGRTETPLLAGDDDMDPPVYARYERIKRATDLRQEVDKNVRLVQKRYKKG